MDLKDFDSWCRSLLQIDALKDIDDSLNGIQVGRSGRPIGKVAFAVDACAESIRRSNEAGADILFVHHGLFWGKPARLEGSLLERIRLLIASDIALYACHLPLDMHPEVGNNAVLADLLALHDRKPFGAYHGIPIGVSGRLESPLSVKELLTRILPDNSQPRAAILPGSEKISTVAIVSGGAPFEAFQAFGKGIDLYITGEPSHSVYHELVENKLNFIAAGHYATEIWGVKAVAARLAKEKGMETLFIDIPTGL
ncbi:MAG TPA: Nif3-like dinuclear metal center hexameric protein [Spirochaetaceae bacterium]|nr:Nif3-like dinuclear metal center hexameric protein [Spirochaetaceae bacterium]